jgi:3-methyladenine DNA glycosylase Tag
MDSEAVQVEEQEPASGAGGAESPSPEDGRTRCAWVRGRPEHYDFHDAEWGRLPDVEELLFERVLMACFERGTPLADVLDQRMEIYEAFHEWDVEKVAAMADADLDGLAGRGGIFGIRDRLTWVREVAQSCLEVKKEFKGLRDYFLVMPGLTPEEALEDVMARFSRFGKDDAANLLQNVGRIGGSIQELSHERDCWIY